MKLRPYLFSAALALFLAAVPLASQAASTPAPASPEDILKAGVGKLVGFMKGGGNMHQLQAFLDTEIAEFFDFGYMAGWVAGPMQRYMSVGERAQFEQGLRRMFLAAMARNLMGSYGNPHIEFQRARRGSRPGEAIVSLRVRSRGAPPMRLDFRFYHGNQGWKIFDVIANGTSAVVHYRNYFRALVRRNGIDGVLRGL